MKQKRLWNAWINIEYSATIICLEGPWRTLIPENTLSSQQGVKIYDPFSICKIIRLNATKVDHLVFAYLWRHGVWACKFCREAHVFSWGRFKAWYSTDGALAWAIFVFPILVWVLSIKTRQYRHCKPLYGTLASLIPHNSCEVDCNEGKGLRYFLLFAVITIF